jgi:hypothetical protein
LFGVVKKGRTFTSQTTTIMKNMKNLLSKSIENLAINLIISGIDPIEAVKIAIQNEQKLISEMLEQSTDRSKKAKSIICKNVYGLIHINS